MANGTTLGNGSSGATGHADADSSDLFTLLWNSYADTEAPVSGGRGGSAAIDFAASKTITLPDARGRVTAAVGGTELATPGIRVGEETHTLTQAELPSATLQSTQTDMIQNAGFSASAVAANGSDITGTVQAAGISAIQVTTPLGGSDAAHLNIQPTLVVGCKIIKL